MVTGSAFGADAAQFWPVPQPVWVRLAAFRMPFTRRFLFSVPPVLEGLQILSDSDSDCNCLIKPTLVFEFLISSRGFRFPIVSNFHEGVFLNLCNLLFNVLAIFEPHQLSVTGKANKVCFPS